MPVTEVASHAYVNPLIALGLGYFVARETLTPSMLLASGLVIASVILILTSPKDRERAAAVEPKRLEASL
jgi:drug/metabolite transporter (DMT)-like permease